MSAQSPLKQYIQTDPECLREYQPVSARVAYHERNNIGHLIDEATQHRINWMTAPGTADGQALTDGGPLLFSQVFAHTWMTPTRPANFVLMVSLSAGWSSPVGFIPYNYEVSIRSLNQPITGTADIAMFSGSIDIHNSTDYTPVNELVTFDGASDSPSSEVSPVSGTEFGRTVTYFEGRARLDIRAWADFESLSGYNSNPVYVSRVLLRECP